jgi:3-hydroxybutyryl-CoA dehydrogenase
MGAGIAEVVARASLDVVVVELDDARVDAGRRRIESSLGGAVRRGKLGEAEATDALGHVRVASDLQVLVDRNFVIEAVPEQESLKLDLFERLDAIVEHPSAVFASNTSSIPIMKLAMATARPERVIGVHFFNPVPVLPLVEVISSLLTADSAVADAIDFVQTNLGKHVIRSQDRAGFIVNALLIPYLLSAIRMLESGFASASDIDQGMVQGCAHPMGPLALADLIGLDTTMAVAISMYEEFKEPLFAPPPLLLRMVDAGLVGRKSGRGFWDYAPDASGSAAKTARLQTHART